MTFSCARNLKVYNCQQFSHPLSNCILIKFRIPNRFNYPPLTNREFLLDNEMKSV